MPLHLLFQRDTKRLLSFEAILTKMDIGIFLNQAKTYKWHKSDSEILRMSLNISHELINCAILNFTEALLSLSNSGNGFIEFIGIVITSAEYLNSTLLTLCIYFSKPPISSILDTILKIFSNSDQVKYEYISVAELHKTKKVSNITNDAKNLKSMWLQSNTEKPENALFLTHINDSTGLVGLLMFISSI